MSLPYAWPDTDPPLPGEHPYHASTVQHLKSDYIHGVIELDVFEHAVECALRGCGYRESLAKANVYCDPYPPMELFLGGNYP